MWAVTLLDEPPIDLSRLAVSLRSVALMSARASDAPSWARRTASGLPLADAGPFTNATGVWSILIDFDPYSKGGVGNGEWRMGSGEWGVGSGEWGVGNGEWGEVEKGEI